MKQKCVSQKERRDAARFEKNQGSMATVNKRGIHFDAIGEGTKAAHVEPYLWVAFDSTLDLK